MNGISAPPPIPGEPIDPPPAAPPDLIRQLDNADGAASAAVGVMYRAITRFNRARSTLLAAGTAFYVFLAMFSLIALTYGLIATLNADRLASYVTEAIAKAFPGLLGPDGVDPDQLRAAGQAASVVGLPAMLYGASRAMIAASGSIHEIYGAPPDSRPYVKKRVRLTGWLVVIGSLIGFSFVAGTVTLNFANRIMDVIGIQGTENRVLIRVAAGVVTLGTDYLVLRLLLGQHGGIRPARTPLRTGCIAGALGIELLRIPMSLILGFSVGKPQYGALAVPIGILLVIYLNSLTVYGAAALTAGIAEREVPVEELGWTDTETARPAP